ncbi:MAG: glycerophosphodiester phosphodiesterase family protein [Planctomycetota bacterium]|nr:glycerophosphodiester phosphodiesterase family protein [Planctomycetota bacterium]
MSRTITSGLCLLIIMFGGMKQGGAEQDPIFKRESPLLFAHRGGVKENPESTREAFRSALKKARADVLEIDIHVTRDQEFVVWHGPSMGRIRILGLPNTLSKRPAKKRRIGDFSWQDELKDKAWVQFREETLEAVPQTKARALMTLKEALAEFPRANFNIEMKSTVKAKHLPALVRLLDKLSKERVLVLACVTHGVLKAFRKACKNRYRTNMSAREILQLQVGSRIGAKLKGLRGRVLETPYNKSLASKTVINKVHSLGGQVYVFITGFVASRALDTTAEGLKYKDIAELLNRGVDGIITDRPMLVRGYIDRWKREQMNKKSKP